MNELNEQLCLSGDNTVEQNPIKLGHEKWFNVVNKTNQEYIDTNK